MNLNLLIFNLAYYLITFLLYSLAKQDPSSSLGIGLFAVIFWIVSAILLAVLCKSKVIKVESLWDKIGIVTATPVPTYLAIYIMFSINSGG